MSENMKYIVKVTQLKLSKPFLKVCAKNVTKLTKNTANALKNLYLKSSQAEITLGETCIANVAQDRYERCRLIQVNGIEKIATLMFIDCGYHGELPLSRLRPLCDSKIREVEPFCKEFILAEMFLLPNTPQEKILNFHDMIVGNTFEMTVLGENGAGRYVDLRLGGNSLSNELISHHPELMMLLKKCPLKKQMSSMLQMKKDKDKHMKEQGLKPVTFVESPEIKARQKLDFELERIEHSVRVTEYDNEPFVFFVQFTYSDDEYQRFQCSLQKFKNSLESEKNTPRTGSLVIAEINDHLYRATIMNIVRTPSMTEAKLELMETGQKCMVNVKQLFKVPSKVSIVPSYAKRFKLAGADKLENGRLSVHEIEFMFKHITKNKLLTLKVVPECDNLSPPSCHLFNNDVNVLDECKRYNPHMLKYPTQKPLTSSVYQVSISSAESPTVFFVQAHDTSEYAQFKAIEEALKHYDPPELRDPKPNDACVVKVEENYMRGQISGLSTPKVFKIQFVDIGFTDECDIKEIKVAVKELMTLPPLAIRCCLKGFENVTDVSTATANNFHGICNHLGTVQMRIVSKKAESLIVELEDSRGGSKIINQLRKMNDLNVTDWTEEEPSISTHFRNRELERSVSTIESSRTLVESPTKSVVHGIEGWDEVKDSVVNSTVLNMSSTEIWDGDEQEISGDWTPGPLFECQKQPVGGVTENEDDLTMTASKSSEPGPSSKLLSLQPSLSSTSGVSSGGPDIRPKGEPVVITAVTSPSDFTLRKLSDEEAYKNHQDEIQRLARAQPPLTIFTKDTYCVALSPFENIWCRSVILDADPVNFMITVKCMDDGSTFTIEEKSQLKTMSVAMLFSPYYAIRCSLPICYSFSKDEQVVKYLISIRDGNLGYEEITKHNDLVFVELYDHQGRNVVETLVEMGLGKRQFVAPNAMALICSLQDSSKFVVQMMSSQEELKQIKEYTEQYQQHDVGTPKEGMLVMALSKKEKLWHRAKIQKISNRTFHVYFIDHGITETVEKIGIIDDPAVACILPVAIICSLYLPPEIRSLNKRAEQRFVKIIEECKRIVYIKMKMPGDDFAIIEIFIEGKDIINLLYGPNEYRKNGQDVDQPGCDEGF